MPEILITSRGKTKRVDLPLISHTFLCVRKVFWPPETLVMLGKYMFKIEEIDTWPPPRPLKKVKLL